MPAPARRRPKTHSNNWPILSSSRSTRGLLFIGDPHVWSHKPGRRRDEDYLGTILGKLSWCATLANERGLWAVVLGDLFHQADDHDLSMISRVMAVMQEFERPPLVLVGNHDLTEQTLTPGTALYVLRQSGCILTMISNGPAGIIDIEDEHGARAKVLVGGTPYGETIPASLAPWAPPGLGEVTHDALQEALGVDKVVWITHDDLAFDHSYPGAIALAPIVGVDVAVNGHMHKAQHPVMKAATAWFNPGNINRLTIDLIDQVPTVWSWSPHDTSTMPGADSLPVPAMTPWIIPHRPGSHILSLEGTIVAEHAKTLTVTETTAETTTRSSFVEHLLQDEHVGRSDDGVFLAGVIDEELNQLQPPQAVQTIVRRLFEQALSQHRKQA